MFELLQLLNNNGLNGLKNDVIDNWVGPAFLIVLAVVGLVLVWKKEIRAGLSFIAVAIIGALFIFAGDTLFGKNGNLTDAGKKAVSKINTALYDEKTNSDFGVLSIE